MSGSESRCSTKYFTRNSNDLLIHDNQSELVVLYYTGHIKTSIAETNLLRPVCVCVGLICGSVVVVMVIHCPLLVIYLYCILLHIFVSDRRCTHQI